jgi:membrane-associated phospholipid phosphatase
MFLNKNNTIKWKRLAFASATVFALVFGGIYWADGFLLPYFQLIHWKFLGSIENVFVWKILAIFSVAGLFLGKIFQIIMNHRYKITEAMQNSFLAIILGQFIVWALGYIVGRMRPPFEQFSPFSGSDIWHSFPSEHTAAIFALFVSIGLIYPKIKLFTWTIAIIASVSSVCYGMNFPSDVLAGAFIGMVCADLIVFIKHRFF